MRSHTRNSILTAACALAILVLCPTLQADSFITLAGYDPMGLNYSYTAGDGSSNTFPVGPYTATLDGVPNILVFCLDLHKDTYVGTTYEGTLDTVDPLSPPLDMSLQQEEEVSFLASYAVNRGDSSLYGPIQMAIWQIMGTLTQKGYNTQPDPAAQQYVDMVESPTTKFSSTLLSSSEIFRATDSSLTGPQRFVTVTPEPATLVFLGTGLLLLALSQIRRRR